MRPRSSVSPALASRARRSAAAALRPARSAGFRPLGGASGARSAELVVARDELERSHEIVDEQLVLEEERAGAIQDRVVDEAEGELNGEAHVRFLGLRQRAAV